MDLPQGPITQEKPIETAPWPLGPDTCLVPAPGARGCGGLAHADSHAEPSTGERQWCSGSLNQEAPTETLFCAGCRLGSQGAHPQPLYNRVGPTRQDKRPKPAGSTRPDHPARTHSGPRSGCRPSSANHHQPRLQAAPIPGPDSALSAGGLLQSEKRASMSVLGPRPSPSPAQGHWNLYTRHQTVHAEAQDSRQAGSLPPHPPTCLAENLASAWPRTPWGSSQAGTFTHLAAAPRRLQASHPEARGQEHADSLPQQAREESGSRACPALSARGMAEGTTQVLAFLRPACPFAVAI